MSSRTWKDLARNKINIHDITIAKKDYSKLMTSLTLSKPYIIFTELMGLSLVVFYFQNQDLGYFYLFLGLGFTGVPVLVFFTVGQTYDRNKIFNEKVAFVVKDTGLDLVGQTFQSSFTWDQITRVRESRQYFLLYQGRTLLALVNKESNAQGVISEWRTFLADKKKLKTKR